MNWSDINTYSGKLLSDPLEAIWDEDEKIEYANECMDGLIEEVKFLVDYRDYALIDGTYLYTVDSDIVEIERFEYSGKHLLPLSPNELKDYDSNFLYETGEVRRWYPWGTKKWGVYKTPTWTADYSVFDTEYGIILDIEYDTDTVTFTDEYGVVLDVDRDESGDVFYFVDDLGYGACILIDEAALSVNLRVVERPAQLSDSTDIPELPTWFHRLIIFYILWRALERDSPGRNEKLAVFWKLIYEDCKIQFFNLYRYSFNSQDHTRELRRMTRTSKYRYSRRLYG